MLRPNPAILIGFVVILITVLGGIGLAKGGIYLSKHEGDTLHLIQILFRMEMGQLPHLDFMTPIGLLAFAPIVAFMKAGFGVGQAFLAAQIAMAAAVAPAAIWVAYSRLSLKNALLFLTILMVLILALVHGEADPSISVSMHYNRWAWALAFIAILCAVLPTLTHPRVWIDGLIIGVAMAALALIKVTYFACFAPVVIAALLVRGERRVLISALGVGLLSVALTTAYVGLDFWAAYVADLLTVRASDIRPQPGLRFGLVVGAPQYLGASFAGLMAVILLRQGGRADLGLLLLLLLPGFFYVTYQNFGNDPQWLWLLAVLVLSQLPEAGQRNAWGWDLRLACQLTVAAVLAFGAPSFFSLAYSPLRHLAEDPTEFTQLLPDHPRHGDIYTSQVRAQRVDGTIALDTKGGGLEAFASLAQREDIATLNGATLTQCEIGVGMVAWMDTIANDLEAAGYAGARLYTADLFNSFWLYGDFPPLRQGSPWYYGGLPGFQDAEYVVVPDCAILPRVRKQILEHLAEAGVTLTEVHRTPLYTLYQPLDLPS